MFAFHLILPSPSEMVNQIRAGNKNITAVNERRCVTITPSWETHQVIWLKLPPSTGWKCGTQFRFFLRKMLIVKKQTKKPKQTKPSGFCIFFLILLFLALFQEGRSAEFIFLFLGGLALDLWGVSLPRRDGDLHRLCSTHAQLGYLDAQILLRLGQVVFPVRNCVCRQVKHSQWRVGDWKHSRPRWKIQIIPEGHKTQKQASAYFWRLMSSMSIDEVNYLV